MIFCAVSWVLRIVCGHVRTQAYTRKHARTSNKSIPRGGGAPITTTNDVHAQTQSHAMTKRKSIELGRLTDLVLGQGA